MSTASRPYESTPDSIILYEAESRWLEHELDLDYIDAAAKDAAEILAGDRVAEIAYQPGDGTFYGIVIVPLRLTSRVRPRVVDGNEWDAHAVRGLLDSSAVEDREGFPRPSGIAAINEMQHLPDAYLVCKVDGECYPLRLGPDRARDLGGGYVAEHWKLSAMSAVTVAVLLRAISYHLGQRSP